MKKVIDMVADKKTKEELKHYINAKSDDELKKASEDFKKRQAAMSESELKESNDAIIEAAVQISAGLDDVIGELRTENIKKKLGELPEAISISYIAKKYFGKSRQWLYQRINGNVVNGKEAHFNETEVKQLEMALRDLGAKLSSVALL